eukprot:CAMPEP_0171568408 /NCGR_PEP_ID=MMETSP0961-20121227/1744_1 /TAXON_ID=87120 /ORGANISM="Aurantiochytrium limacinum, Strain ATCCMYA-1381" /LENGTH=38 /DNA_ID= /DNA_START= /DNA_END= /DNA_ORIENTATION=
MTKPAQELAAVTSVASVHEGTNTSGTAAAPFLCTMVTQ